jgi:glutamate synthase domain-containing protein 3
MSLKSIDMQFAVQKSTETGMKQNQLQHRPVLDQSMLATQEEKKIEKDRQRSSKVDETANHRIRDDQQKGKNKWLNQEKKKQDKSITNVDEQHTANNLEHPYKGRHIDLSL